jgi:hypothetical protein
MHCHRLTFLSCLAGCPRTTPPHTPPTDRALADTHIPPDAATQVDNQRKLSIIRPGRPPAASAVSDRSQNTHPTVWLGWKSAAQLCQQSCVGGALVDVTLVSHDVCTRSVALWDGVVAV